MEPMPNFEVEKYPIGAEAIAAEVERLIMLGDEAKGKQTNRFPVEAFPEPLQQIILETNANLNFPIDFIGASLLYAVSVAIGNTHKVEVKRKCRFISCPCSPCWNQ